MKNPENILECWDIDPKKVSIKPFGSGHIHSTFLVLWNSEPAYILQRINTSVFVNPEAISQNIREVGVYLKETSPAYVFPAEIQTSSGQNLAEDHGDKWRLTAFIKHSYSPNQLERPEQAYEAARAFGELTRLLNDFPASKLTETIPGFHNLRMRFSQFEDALERSPLERRLSAKIEIDYHQAMQPIVAKYDEIVRKNLIPKRIQHHDTKINNVLFDKNTNRAVAVCDLDTLMPGYFISDLGDMIRTYTSAENEESTAWDKIRVRPEYLKSLMEGYLSEMKSFLTDQEKNLLSYAGEFMIYMQGLRFLTDHLNGNVYYPVKHDLHNLHRARNQMILLEDYQKQNF